MPLLLAHCEFAVVGQHDAIARNEDALMFAHIGSRSIRPSYRVLRIVVLFQIVLIPIALGVAWILWNGMREAQLHVNAVIRCDERQVNAIRLLPSPEGKSLVLQPITVNDRQTIVMICQALRTAQPFFPNHPIPEWEVVLELCAERMPVAFQVLHSIDPKNGTLLYVFSHGTQGWLYGTTYRCDDLATILESIAHPPGPVTRP